MMRYFNQIRRLERLGIAKISLPLLPLVKTLNLYLSNQQKVRDLKNE